MNKEQTTEEKLGIIAQPPPLCYSIDDIINFIERDDNGLTNAEITQLNFLIENLRTQIINLREWGQAYKYKTIYLLEKQKYNV